MSLIEIRDVHKWYGEFHVLKGISEKVEKGEVLVICGPSGSGKSTFIRCLNRLEPIQKGDILFEGTSIYAPEVDVNALRAEVGMVFQQFNLYPHLTVLENVTLAPIKVRGMGKKEATDLAMDVFPVPGGPTRQIIGLVPFFVRILTARYSNTRSFTFSRP